MTGKGGGLSLNLPAPLRRRIAYATTATLLIGGLAYAVTPQSSSASKSSADESAAAPLAASLAADAEPVTQDEEYPAVARTEPQQPVEQQEARPKVITYTVVEGDTVEAIANKYGLKTETVLWSNDMSEWDILQIGQELKIPAVDGVVHTVAEGDTLWDISAEYGVEFSTILEANPEINPEALAVDTVLLIPGGEPVVSRSRGELAARGSARSAGFVRWPVYGDITDWYGWRWHPVYGGNHFHDGIDIGVYSGTPVSAVARGRVTYVGWMGGYGITVKLDHGDGVESMYSHLSEAIVSWGDVVNGGETIAYSGNTGTSTGPHLHFTVLLDGSPVDPMSWLP